MAMIQTANKSIKKTGAVNTAVSKPVTWLKWINTILLKKNLDQLASCLTDGQTKWAVTNQLSGRGTVICIRSFTEPDLFDNNVPFDNTTPIYLINLLWKLGLVLGLDLQLLYFHIFRRE